MSGKRRECRRHVAAVEFRAAWIVFQIRVDFRAGLKTEGPAVVHAFFDDIERISRTIVAEMI